MGEPSKKSSNVTVEQIIEHMTADIPNADGQYIQLGFTPPPTPNDSHNWSEYSQNQLPPNPFVPHFTPRTAETIPYALDPNARFMSQNVAYGNYMAQNAIYVPEMQNNGYEKHLNMDIHGNKYVVYSNQQPQYVMTNQDIPVCGYMPVYPENRDYALFANQELQNIQMQQQNAVLNNSQNSEQMFMPENVLIQQNHNELKNKLLMHQNISPQQNRTHLIENLVCNWAQNTNGTYSPFGNSPQQNNQTFFENVKQPDITSPNSLQISENSPNLPDSSERNNDFNVKNFKTPINKKKQVAEVKPMRPTYSDVLTKSVPIQSPKTDKIESVKDPKTKNSVKKSSKADKFAKISLNRQSSTNDKENQISNGQKFDKSTDSKVNLPRKWVSLDDVNEVHTNDLFKVPDLNESGNQKNSAKKKKFESPNLKNDSKNGVKKSFLDNSSLGCQWTESEDISEGSKNDDRNVNKNPTKKGNFLFELYLI